MLNITLSSDYEEYWRYNVVVICGGYSTQEEQLFVTGDEVILADDVTPYGGVRPIPADDFAPEQMTINFECEEADHLVVSLNVIPHLLPKESDIRTAKPFGVELLVSDCGEVIYLEKHKVDQSSGISKEITIKC